MSILVVRNNDLDGAQNQAMGVARVLAHKLFGEERITTVRMQPRACARQLACTMHRTGFFSLVGPTGPTKSLWRSLFSSDHPITVKPDIIVSTLGNSEHASVALATFYRIPNVHIGEPKHFRPDCFNMIVAAGDGEEGPNRLLIDTAPTHLLARDADCAAVAFRRQHGVTDGEAIWCMLAGGNCNGYTYSDQDWEGLAHQMRVYATHYKVRWVLSTSRRTGARAEAILRRELADAHWLLDAIWWTSTQKRSIAGYIGAAELCFVTEESISMVSDCVSLGRPVYACAPAAQPKAGADPRIKSLLGRLQAKGRVQRVSCVARHQGNFIARTRGNFSRVSDETRWDTKLVRRAEELGIL